MKYIAAAVLAVTSFSSVSAQSSAWCGKNFMPNQTVVPPGGQFQLPASSNEPLVAFRCAPAFRPYLEEDAKDAAFIIDTPIVYQYVQGASLISLPSSGSECDDLGTMDVQISIGHIFARQAVPLNSTGYEITVDISSLPAQKMGYNVTCNATYQAETPSSPTPQCFSTNASLLYLPDTNGSVVKTDLRTGALWARPADGKGCDFQPFIPQGFYVPFDQYLAKNLSLIDQLKADGFNTIHPIPPYDNATLFEQLLNRTVELGLYLIYDMRSNYQNLTAVTQQVQAYSSLPNLLLWETAHEPDGSADPFSAARSTYDLIYEMDGYHPISIVLNCEDYNFAPYVEGADIVLEDAYPVGINATFSPVWHAECTPDFGHCGCDDCTGSIHDITARIQSFKDRLNILGYDRTKTVWSTPQAFGSGAYWNTTPTGPQWAAMGLTSFSHGATGSISFKYPTTTGNTTTIEGTATALTVVIAETVQPFLVDPEVTHETFSVGGVDAGLWDNGTAYLLLVTSFDAADVYVAWADVGLGEVTDGTTQVQQIFSVGQTTNATGLNSCPGGIGVYVATPPE
ncbi:hypothetical protein L210DRAFT_857297 [Boletus edulis BED1]|uniref:Glycoside hydrolase family 5 protein n=1 Tax=Boletus edulis BED1 TaxID=1328754 RepID=A0AAD4BTW6_BOLED|nr:hypothetical protein L210DRAFT_857297 [Boletus edulis BED1]